MSTTSKLQSSATVETDGFTIRRMTAEEMPLMTDWAAAEGWNPGLYDAECFRRADPNGFFAGCLDGQVIAVCSAVAYDSHFAFAGHYIVKPEFRRRGYGMRMTGAWLDYVGERTVGLDGVLDMQEKYERIGFRTAHRSARYEGVGGGDRREGVLDSWLVPFDALVDYDARHFPARREEFIDAWVDRSGTRALAAIRGGRIVGYGVIRPCRSGLKIGPLFADDPEAAEDLFQSLAAAATDEAIFLDVPLVNRAAVSLAERHAMTPVFETARMYRNAAPELPLDEVFGITSFELG